MKTNTGRIDAVFDAGRYLCLVEFKLEKSAEAAVIFLLSEAGMKKFARLLILTLSLAALITLAAGAAPAAATDASAGAGSCDGWTALLEQYQDDPETNQLLFIKYKGNSKATAEFYVKKNGNWKRVFRSIAYVGLNGLGKEREGDKKTPTGIYNLTGGFGAAPDPGTTDSMPYVQVNEYMYLCADKEHYNQLIDIRDYPHECRGEHLIDSPTAYRYGMFLDYNKDNVYKKGSAIFLHCKGRNKYTSGCIALSENRMVQILKRVTKGAKICIYRK